MYMCIYTHIYSPGPPLLFYAPRARPSSYTPPGPAPPLILPGPAPPLILPGPAPPLVAVAVAAVAVAVADALGNSGELRAALGSSGTWLAGWLAGCTILKQIGLSPGIAT